MKVIDESTIELAKTGDNNSLSEIVNAYSPNIYSLSLKFMRNKHDAEDVLQETFLKMLNSISKFEGRAILSMVKSLKDLLSLSMAGKKNQGNFH